jgi:tellurite resistance protein TehA-like permease
MDEGKRLINEFAIASLIMGIFSFVRIFNVEKGIVAVIFGILALKKIKENIQLKGKNFAVAGMILGVVSIIITIILTIKFMPQMMQMQQQMMQHPMAK